MRTLGNAMLVTSIAAALGFFFACGNSSGDGDTETNDGGGDVTVGLSDTGAINADASPTCNPCNDFPNAPVIDPGTPLADGGPGIPAAPANAAALFSGAPGANSGATGPCIVEPELGTLYPSNWLRPRFRYLHPTHNLFEIRLHSTGELNDLVVYTRSPAWTMPKAMWQSVAANVQGKPFTLTIRSATYDDAKGTITDGPSAATNTDFTVAPAPALGSVVYWVTSTSSLKGFSIGDEGVTDILNPTQAGVGVTDASPGGGCIGCHSSAGDGKYVLASTVSGGNGSLAWITVRSSDGKGATPDSSVISDSANALLLRQVQEAPTTSSAHFKAGDRLLVSNFQPANSPSEIIWTDLEATSQNQYDPNGAAPYAGTGWGVFLRTGDVAADGVTKRQGGEAAFSHDGTKIAYVSAANMAYGLAVLSNDGDIKTIPFADRKGGAATPVPGAATPEYSEYYPTFSPQGDKLLAFDRAPANVDTGSGNGDNYANPKSEVYVVPSTGAPSATRLSANDPPVCLGGTNVSPGVSNSWPKWGPSATDVGGKTYYWIVFSSTRAYGYPQLYLSSVVVDDATGSIDASHGALYLWNQPNTEHNHTPAWDYFEVPPSGPR